MANALTNVFGCAGALFERHAGIELKVRAGRKTTCPESAGDPAQPANVAPHLTCVPHLRPVVYPVEDVSALIVGIFVDIRNRVAFDGNQRQALVRRIGFVRPLMPTI